MTDRHARHFRFMMAILIVGLVISGVTAFPLTYEVESLCRWLGIPDGPSSGQDGTIRGFLHHVRDGLRTLDAEFPWAKYGTDWLAFGHLVIALFFEDPMLRPRVDHRGPLLARMIACLGVIPLALIAGAVREIPFAWRLLDCAFGVLGVIPLAYAWRLQRPCRR